MNTPFAERVVVILLLVVGFLAGTAIMLGSKLLALCLFTLGVILTAVGHFGKRKRAEIVGVVLLWLSIAAVFLPFDIGLEFGSAWRIGMQSDFETVSKDGRTFERYKYDYIPIGTKVRWRVVLYVPHKRG